MLTPTTATSLTCAPSTADRRIGPDTIGEFRLTLRNISRSSFFSASINTAEGRSDAAARREKLLTLALDLYADGKDPLSVADGVAKEARVSNAVWDWACVDGAAQFAESVLARTGLRAKARSPHEQALHAWALVGHAVTRAIQQGQSWRALVARLAPDTADTQSLYTFEKRIVARFGMSMVDTHGSVERAARHLELSHAGEEALARAWVEQRGAQALADEPRHAVVAERMQLCEVGRLNLERLCTRLVGMERVAAGHSCTQAARELGLRAFSLELLRRRVALSMGVQRLHAAAGGPVDVDDLDLGPDWTAALHAVGRAGRAVTRNGFAAVAMRR